jgi:26S proteasome regulatory subunit T1
MAPEPEDDIMNEKNPRPLDEDDIALLKTYVSAPLHRIDLSVRLG